MSVNSTGQYGSTVVSTVPEAALDDDECCASDWEPQNPYACVCGIVCAVAGIFSLIAGVHAALNSGE